MDSLLSLVLGWLIVISATSLCAQAKPPIVSGASPSSAAAATITVRGQVSDPTGALIPGVSITLNSATGDASAAAMSDPSGNFVLRGLTPGDYNLAASFAGFLPFHSAITLTTGQAKRVNIVMAVEIDQQNVVVSDEAAEVNLDAGSNTSSVLIKGDDLGALSDDPDELASELSALAGPAAGPNGGEIFIDGFSGGELPPKSAILEVRVNQNPFSAEFDKLGYGRTEILTKPGTEKLHGQALLQGNHKSFNTGNPFTADIPAYYSYQFSGSLSGAISKRASFFLSVDSRDLQSVNAWRIPDAVLPNSAGTYVDNFNYAVSLLSPHVRDNASLRFDWQVGKKTTMTARYGYWYENEKGNLDSGPGTLASGSTHESNSDHTVQLSSTTIFNDHFINESRFQFERHDENHYPDSSARTIGVAGDFVGGGFTGQFSQDHRIAIEFQNLSTMTHGKHAFKLGTRLRDNRDANKSNAKFNGRFDFSPVTIGSTDYTASQVYARMANGLAAGQSFNSLVQQGFGPTSASYATGNLSAVANVFDAAFFLQDDFKMSPRLTLSGGIRWESQNHIADHNDWGPRAALAYSLDGGNGRRTKAVLRAGFGFFYDRLSTPNLMSVQHASMQTQIVLNNPTCSSTASSLDAINLATCTNGAGVATKNTAPVQYQIAPHYHAPYTEQAGLSIERQLTAATSVTLTYLHSFGVHEQVLRNANQAIGGVPATASKNYLYQFFPEAIFKQHQLITSVKTRIGRDLNLSGFYTWSTADSNGAGAINNNYVSNAYDLNQDYGRANFVLRHVAFVTATYNGPWKLVFNPFLIAQSGKPFNITLATDPLNNLFNQRPTYATSSTPAADQVMTPFGLLDTAALPGEKLIPANLGTSPAAVAVNLRISRAFAFGGEHSTASRGAGAAPVGDDSATLTAAPTSNTSRPDRGAPGGGSLGPGGLSSSGGGVTVAGAGGAGGRRYALRFSIQALNIFNNIDYGTPIGVLGTPSFGRSTSLAGGAFSTGSAARRIFAQASISF